MVRVVAISKLEWGYLRIRWLQKWTNVSPFNVGGSQKSVRVCLQLAVLVAVVVVAAVFVLFFGGGDLIDLRFVLLWRLVDCVALVS